MNLFNTDVFIQLLSYISATFLENFPPETRNGRTILTKIQKKILKEHYERNKFPNRWEKTAIANQTGLHPIVVSNWFQNQRTRNKTIVPQPYMDNEKKTFL